jgi:hypothetical protein
MMLLLRIVAYLDGRGVVSALIGGGALAAHGIARATLDFDLLVVDRAVLVSPFWDDFPATVELRPGDADDPLAGVVRVSDGGEAVDVIVGKHAWEAQMLARRVTVTVELQPLPTVDRADLVLLKLFAGGPQDLLDVRLLLAADTGNLRNEVEQRVLDVPVETRRLWKSVCTDRTDG